MKIKVTIVGDTCVGKTFFCNQIRKIDSENYIPTIGVHFFKYVKDKYVVEIWDTSGQSIYQSIIKPFISNSDVLLCIYKDLVSFQHVKNIAENSGKLVYLINVGRLPNIHIKSENIFYLKLCLSNRVDVVQCLNLVIKTLSRKTVSNKNRSFCWFY